MSERPYPLWWADRYDPPDDGYDPRDDPANDDFEPVLDADEPIIACQFDERDGDDL